MLYPIKVNSYTIELTVHTSCYCILDLELFWFMDADSFLYLYVGLVGCSEHLFVSFFASMMFLFLSK